MQAEKQISMGPEHTRASDDRFDVADTAYGASDGLLITFPGGEVRGTEHDLDRILRPHRCYELVYQAGDHPYICVRTPNGGITIPRSVIAASHDPRLRRANTDMGLDGDTIPNRIMRLAARRTPWRNMLDPALHRMLGFGVHGCSPEEANTSSRNIVCKVRKVVRSVHPEGGFLASKPSNRDKALYAIGSNQLKSGWPIFHVMSDLTPGGTS